MTERPVLIPGGHYEATARHLAAKLAGAAPWEPVEVPEDPSGTTSPALGPWPSPLMAEVRKLATAGLLLLGLVTLLFFIP